MRTFLVLLWLAMLSGCNLITYDRSNAPGMDALVGRSFTTVKDSFLIKDACTDEYSTKNCLELAAVGGIYRWKSPQSHWAPVLEFELPMNYQAYLDSPTSATVEFSETRLNAAPKDQLQWVPRGSVVTITRLISLGKGESGRFWVVYGRLADTPVDTSIEIASYSARPQWFKKFLYPSRYGFPPEADDFDKPPIPDPAFLTPVVTP